MAVCACLFSKDSHTKQIISPVIVWNHIWLEGSSVLTAQHPALQQWQAVHQSSGEKSLCYIVINHIYRSLIKA